MSEERSTVLEMLAAGKVSKEEAERLLDATTLPSLTTSGAAKGPEDLPKHLYIQVTPKEGFADSDRVKATIPLALIKAGINLFSLLPKETRDEVEEAIHDAGVNSDLKNLGPAEWEALVVVFKELKIDVETKKNTVKIWAG